MAQYDTVANVVSDAAAELGLGTISDVFGSTDPLVVQMRTLLKSVGQRLALSRQWTQLTAEGTITTANGTASYNLPADFASMVDQSGWNRTTAAPVVPVDAQTWQYMKAASVTSTILVTFRPRESTVEIYPTPTTAESIKFDYRSRYWVRNTGGTTLDKDAPTANTDVLMFDRLLLVSELKLAFKRAKGMDTNAAQQDADMDGMLVAGANVQAAPVLSLTGKSGPRLLDTLNVPETGYGS